MDTEPADGGNPQAALEQRAVARHLLQHPLTCAEHDPDIFRLIRRHEATVDRWFTQRLGYRLHVDTDTARLYKTTYIPEHRPLRVAGRSERSLHQLEYTLLALLLASTAAGPAVISLRDLVREVRSAAAEAEIDLNGDATERRALVTALRWMIDHGLATEIHERVETFMTDETADAVLRVRPDRIALVPAPAMAGATDPDQMIKRSERRDATRQWLRCRLVEDPVVYRSDCTEAEWGELRRRLGEEASTLDVMFGMSIEARAEGVAAIDPSGRLSDRRFPAGGTVGHASLLLIERVVAMHGDLSEGWITMTEVVALVTALAAPRSRRWAGDLVEAPERLTDRVIELLTELRLCERSTGVDAIRLLPAAARFIVDPDPDAAVQSELW